MFEFLPSSFGVANTLNKTAGESRKMEMFLYDSFLYAHGEVAEETEPNLIEANSLGGDSTAKSKRREDCGVRRSATPAGYFPIYGSITIRINFCFKNCPIYLIEAIV